MKGQQLPKKDDVIIRIKDLSYSRADRVIFDNVNLEIRRGAITAIMGPSGTGKTTLLKLIGGLLLPDHGSIEINGRDISTLSMSELIELRTGLGMLFQSGALFTDMTVYENVAFPLREHTNLPEDMIRILVLMKLQAVGLRGACDLMPRELSGGMARRVALARTIALDPEIILFDEPFTGQDPIAMGVLVQLIRLLNDALNMTSVIVSHDVDETASIADYIYIVSNGQVIGQGEPRAMLHSKEARIHQFINGLPDGPVPFHFPAQDYKDDLMME